MSMSDLKLTILGCGNSTGVPAVGNVWGDCDPHEPKNRRARCSVAVQSDQTTLIIDTGPDFREQMNTFNIQAIDGILYTHEHADHMHGIDDLRFYRFKQQDLVPTYLSAETYSVAKEHFGYMFDGGSHVIYKPILKPHIVEFGHNHRCGDIDFIPFAQDHGSCVSTGYRFGNCAYSVDLIDLSDESIDLIRGIDVWIVDAAAHHNENNQVHATIEKIITMNERIGAQSIILTSLSIGMDYQTLCDELPDYIRPAYDGMSLEIK